MLLNNSGGEFKTIIFATDLSLFSQASGIYSAAFARLLSARLLVVHAFTLSQAALEVEVDSSLISQQRKDLEVLLSQKAAELSRNAIEAVPLLLDGDPREILPGLESKYESPLLVLGTRSEGRLGRKVVGSVAEKTLRRAQRPVLTVGPKVRNVKIDLPQFRRILFATDLCKGAENAATVTAHLASRLGAELDVLNVVEDKTVDHPDRLEEVMKHFYQPLDAVVPEGAKNFLTRTFVEAGNAQAEILRHIEERSIDLLVLSIHKSSPLGMQRKTSGVFRLISEAACPVLTIPS